jgi:hypothetical protein
MGRGRVVGVGVEWRRRRMAVRLNQSAGSEEAGGAGTQELGAGEGEGRSQRGYRVIHNYRTEAESWIF